MCVFVRCSTSQPVVPVGIADEPKRTPVKLYCPRCREVCDTSWWRVYEMLDTQRCLSVGQLISLIGCRPWNLIKSLLYRMCVRWHVRRLARQSLTRTMLPIRHPAMVLIPVAQLIVPSQVYTFNAGPHEEALDGAFFGTSFAHMFIMSFDRWMPDVTAVRETYTPTHLWFQGALYVANVWPWLRFPARGASKRCFMLVT